MQLYYGVALLLLKKNFRSNKTTIVFRAGCLSPLSIRLCPEHSWISRDISADASVGDAWVCMTAFTQQLPRRFSRRRRGNGDRLPALQDKTLLRKKENTQPRVIGRHQSQPGKRKLVYNRNKKHNVPLKPHPYILLKSERLSLDK